MHELEALDHREERYQLQLYFYGRVCTHVEEEGRGTERRTQKSETVKEEEKEEKTLVSSAIIIACVRPSSKEIVRT